MSKMDEQILAVDRMFLFDNEVHEFQGLLRDKDKVSYLMKKFNQFIEVRRGDAEENVYLKQPIPYAIVRRGEEVFLYKRLNKGGEHRLHDQLSIGVGGHMNRVNDIHNWHDNLIYNLHRELNEELDISINAPYDQDPKIIGLINDDNNEVGQVHIGILAIVDLPPEAEVSVRETDALEGYWTRIKDLKKSPLFESLETWSQMAVDIL